MAVTACNGCGRCCDPVALPFTQQEAARCLPDMMDPANRRWVLDDLTPIRRKDALAMVRDYMHGGKSSFALTPTAPAQVMFTHFYSCRHYNPESRQCEAYDMRPPICEGFPWYDQSPDSSKAIPPECSFNADIGQPVAAPIRR